MAGVVVTLLDTPPTGDAHDLDAPTAGEAAPAAGEPSRPPTWGPGGLTWLRMIVLCIGYVIVGAAAGGVFDRFQWGLVVAPMVPTIVALGLSGRSGWLRVPAAALAVVVSVAIAVAITGGGSLTDVVDSFTAGAQRLLSTDWPSPTRADLVGTIAAVLAVATALSDELVLHRRWHLLPLSPLLVSYVLVLGLSAPLGVEWGWLIALGVVCTVFATLRDVGALRERLMLLRGERRLLPLVLIALALAALVSVPIVMATRADPRRNDPPQRTEPLLDPIEATLALRDLDPPVDLHVITGSDDAALPGRWRTAALANYDGQRWTPVLTLRPIGGTLGPITGEVLDIDISFLVDDLTLVPLAGSPVSIDASVETDPSRTIVRLVERPSPGDVIAVESNVPPTTDDAAQFGLAVREVDEGVSGLTELALALGGDGTPLEQLRQLETTMREDFVLDSTVQGGGLQRALIERFLRDTRRGTAEQFAAGFVLLTRSLGVDARVATGFASEGPATGSIDLDSADAAIWPEVRIADPDVDDQWLAFDPVPEEEASDATPPPPEPQVQTPAAPQPPIAPPPDPTEDPTATEEPEEPDPTSPLSQAITVVGRGVVVAGALLLPILVLIGLILGVKFRRRRRRLNAPEPTDRIRGAWANATDALVDAGLTIGASATDNQIADDGEPLAPTAHRELHRLATLSSAATYGNPARPDLLVGDATTCLDVVEDAVVAERTRWQRIRWRLSLRSLRSTTRSPVTD